MSGSMTIPGAQPIRAPGQGQIDNHLQASQMAHAAAQRAAVAKVLARGSSGHAAPGMSMGAAAPPHPTSYKHHVLAMAGMPGAPAAHVHAAIDQATQLGHFTPQQGADLKAHDGPLLGPPGAQTIATLGSTLNRMKGQP